ncbi:hypothetical protein WH8501_16165 [Crocosphaera watsonii WH 8501]|uniref:hypothetical protein n=1 Tax=Crocosphaera watsonii TaxID=263511 RepID=UPI0002E4D5EF|nr:hypothetical protein [Crocosphaera watsonii]
MTINKVGGFTPIGDVLDLMIKEFSNNSYARIIPMMDIRLLIYRAMDLKQNHHRL